MKNKGFTLVEVLAVIIILGLIALIVVPPVIDKIGQATELTYDTLISSIKQTTQLYIRNNRDEIDGINQVDNVITITIQDLVDEEGFKTPVVDPRTDKEISLTTEIEITVLGNNNYDVSIPSIVYVE